MEYTAESGVKSFKQAIDSFCRNVAYEYAICKD